MCNLSNADALEAYGYEVVDLGNGWLEITYLDNWASWGERLTMQIADDPEAVASFLATNGEVAGIADPDWPTTQEAWPAEFTVELGPTE